MSNIKLVHSGGNSVSLTTTTSNPASNKTFKLPQADGSAGQVLQTDGNGNLTFVNPGGISFSQQWRLTSNKSTSSTSSDISANLEVVDSDGYGGLGGTMTQSSGIFTFPSTGIYLILAKGSYSASGGSTSNYNEMDLHTTTDNSTFNRAAIGWCYIASGGYGTAACDFMFDVTNTSTHKVKFRGASASSNAYLTANTNDNQTHFTFIKLG